ncbi:hypothetical protein HPB50_012837 [Hyalomma asiaticum]|uniref:Uncharacterized protein n=1 Tax=Hyalomma asiaticum TaxID=266040 RepID=A0ACB7RWY0_HYAAI|nr:hypothetical protein HPB50_012837 [Hyalomma asiaticum]
MSANSNATSRAPLQHQGFPHSTSTLPVYPRQDSNLASPGRSARSPTSRIDEEKGEAIARSELAGPCRYRPSMGFDGRKVSTFASTELRDLNCTSYQRRYHALHHKRIFTCALHTYLELFNVGAPLVQSSARRAGARRYEERGLPATRERRPLGPAAGAHGDFVVNFTTTARADAQHVPSAHFRHPWLPATMAQPKRRKNKPFLKDAWHRVTNRASSVPETAEGQDGKGMQDTDEPVSAGSCMREEKQHQVEPKCEDTCACSGEGRPDIEDEQVKWYIGHDSTAVMPDVYCDGNHEGKRLSPTGLRLATDLRPSQLR